MVCKIALSVVVTCVWFLIFLGVLSLVKLAGGDSFLAWSISITSSIGWTFSLGIVLLRYNRC